MTQEILTLNVHREIDAMGEHIRSELRHLTEGLPITVSGGGPFFKLNASGRKIFNYRDAVSCDKEWQRLASLALLNRDIVISGSLAGCTASTTTDMQVSSLLEGVKEILNV